ncbi:MULTISPECIES: hypothetical protein [Sphingobacterium]|nr:MULTISPECIES: hypothetical protein [Sphingobacterium]
MSIRNVNNITISNNIMTEICPNCNFSYNPNINGVYNFDSDGVMYLVKDLDNLKLSSTVISKIKETAFLNIKTGDDLIKVARSIDKSLYDKVISYFKKGIVFTTVLSALINFQCLLIKPHIKAARATIDLIENVNKANLIPGSARRSFIDSLTPPKKTITISKPQDRNIEEIKGENLINKLNDN